MHRTASDQPTGLSLSPRVLEPWASLPSRQDVVEELSGKSDLIHLAPGAEYENTWSIAITEE